MLKLNNLKKTYKSQRQTKVFENLNMSVNKGEFVAIFGPNGCGKSTLLNLIAGLTQLDEGRIVFDGKKVEKLNIGFVFQDYKSSLFPWLKAGENIAFPFTMKNMQKDKADALVKKIYEKYDCNFNLEAYPYELSGGQQQLVALLRSLIIHPDIFLLDEPFSSLDYQTTLLLLEKLSMIWHEMKITTLFVSHEIDDAIFLAQKIILLSNKPTRIIKTFTVPKSYPRKLSFMGSKQFNSIKSNILTLYA
ncbi:hypothetical protein A2Z00_05030, partial [Candidatus Gottesmanbacteria bacterium RBG_13_45_10]